MVFDARTAQAHNQASEPFEFTGLDGKSYELPNIRSLSGEQISRFNNGDETVLSELADEATIAAMDALNLGAQKDLALAWMVHGGELGKEQLPSYGTQTPPRRSASISSGSAARRRGGSSRSVNSAG